MTPNSTQRTFLGVPAGAVERAAGDTGDADMANHSLREVVKETWEGRRPAGAQATTTPQNHNNSKSATALLFDVTRFLE
jgi:hypothetical protein